MKYKGIILDNCVCVRHIPSLSGKIVKLLSKDTVVELYEKKDNWYKYENYGWICSRLENGTKLISIEPISEKNTKSNIPKKEKTSTNNNEENKEEPVRYFKDYVSKQTYEDQSNSASFIKSVRGIHGMPYQFLPSVDPRPDSSNFGRKYSSKILSRIPLLLLTPGVPEFLGGYSESDKQDLTSYILNRGGKDDGIIKQLIGSESNKDGKFYSFKFAYSEYYKYVNVMLRNMSRFLNIHNKTIDNIRLDNYSWDRYTNNAFKNFVSSAENIAFYIDSDTQITESFENEVTESSLASSVNKMSDLAREIGFLLGGSAGIEFDFMKSSEFDNNLEAVKSFTDKYVNIIPSNIIEKITSGVLTVSSGGKMIFPKIWADSSFSRSYDISIKLTTPESDNYSWFMNIGVPLIHLIALVAPRQLGSNSYQSPFLVRGYYKGFFNCDMGIITSMDIKKGDKGKWTTSGLPTVVDVNFNLKDLYQIMSISREDKIADLIKNTALLDYIANLCGINVNKPDILRTIDIYYKYIENKVLDVVSINNFLGVEQALTNAVNSIFRKFTN